MAKYVIKRLDWGLVFLTFTIMSAGIAILYSASHNFGYQFILRQLLWMALGIILVCGILLMNQYRMADISYYLYAVNILLLAAVLLFGSLKLGARRWLAIGAISLQPSEFAKVTVILALARYLSGIDRAESGLRHIVIAAAIAATPAALTLTQPDLGTSLVFFPILLVMLYWKGIDIKYIISLLILAAAATPIGWMLLKDYQRARLLVFMNPDMEPLGAGYTIIQSKIAIGSGGLLGKGWLSGTQSQLNFLPERHTDFIFPVLAEEWGLVGSCILVLLYLLFIRRIFNIAEGSKHEFARLASSGIMALFLIHISINIAMTMGLVPVVGLPLPFITYGGSWLITCLAAVGLLLSIRASET